MRSIRISDEVWEAIAAKGRFGETEDDVLRRVFGVKDEGLATTTTRSVAVATPVAQRLSPRLANIRMHAGVHNDQLQVSFESGIRKDFPLPKKTDVEGIRRVRTEAVRFASSNGASPGQQDAVKKALTQAGYHIRGARG